MKKLLALILTAALVLSFTACGGDNSQPSPDAQPDVTPVVTQQPEDKKLGSDFSQKVAFMGKNVYYPEFGGDLIRTDYGYMLEYNGCMVYMEAPGAAGVMLDAKTPEDALLLSEQYIYKSVEEWTSFMFMAEKAHLNVVTKENKTVNGIEMLRVTGTLDDTFNNIPYDFTGYFFVCGEDNNIPAYIYGYEMAGATMDIVEFMDEMASHITKN